VVLQTEVWGPEQAPSLSAVAKLKTRYLAASSQATLLKQRIASEPSWAWANNATLVGQLQQATEHMQAKTRELDVFDLVADEIKSLRAFKGAEWLASKAKDFASLEPDRTGLEACLRRLLAMHKESARR
jgi:hypothetical protein